jgi:protein-export membrane protein SecD
MKRRPARRRLRLSWNAWVLLLILSLLGTAIWVLTPSGSTSLDREKDNWGMRLGLDLAGGSHLVYQADFQEDWSDGEKEFYLDMAHDTIRDRIDRYGVTEPVIQKQGGDRILVQLPGITDVERAKALIEETGFLEFREVELNEAGKAVLISDYLDDPDRTEFFDIDVEGTRIFARIYRTDDTDEKVTLPYALTEVYVCSTCGYIYDPDKGDPDSGIEPGTPFEELPEDWVCPACGAGKEDFAKAIKWLDSEDMPVDPEVIKQEFPTDLYCWMPGVGEVDGEVRQLTGAYLSEALPYLPPPEAIDQEISVNIKWNEQGADLFDQIAARLYPKHNSSYPIEAALGIFLDVEVISYPQILQEEYEGEGSITGGFSWEEARRLAIQLNSGALPMPLKKPPLYESEVSATLGADFIHKALLAGAIGLGVVVLFMLLYYRLPGALASLALLVYVPLVLAIFKLIPVTLTLAGLAGFILSIGMAVDANVLIFERLKEELRGGRTLKAAVETGFNRAWIAIRDSNISTFIICGILYWFGSRIVDSPPVMGFAVTLAIGVAVSMFSAIVVTRTFLRFSTGRRAARNLAWFGVRARDV